MVEGNKEQYDKMTRLALDVLSDYGFYRFPLDVFSLAEKIGMKLIPYSTLTLEQYMTLFHKYDMDLGLTVPRLETGYIVYNTYYNDVDMQEPRQRFTIAHEIKHVVAGDFLKKEVTENDEALADFFAKSLLAPQAIIVQEGLSSPEEYVERFRISLQSAEYCYSAVENRKSVYGKKFLFDYEREFLETIKKIRLNEKIHIKEKRIKVVAATITRLSG